jgi:2,3-dihydro-2,3-dihydroxybenzoate dehydrogenase
MGISTTGSTVVVGAAQGIGRAVAERLAPEAWIGHLWLADINVEAVESLAAELAGHGVECSAAAVDLADPASIERLVAATGDANQVAIVAGIFASSSALETSKDEFDRVLAINLVGTFVVAQAYAREMVARGAGSICGVASIAARMPRMRQAAYAASKAGMRQAFRVLALETVPHGVTVNTVSPGPTDTPMMRRMGQDHPNVDDLAQGSPEAFRPRIPAGRVGRTGDVASAVAFLLHPDNRHIAMQDLVVDGGELLGM